jgi:hypothetical protein
MIQMLEIFFEPAFQDRRYDPREYNSVDRAMSAAAIKLEHRVFRSPGHAVFLSRALVGLDAYLQQFGTVANYHRLFAACIADAEQRSHRSRRAAARSGES